jgi:2-phosphosulfolactate phosphatase
MRIEVAFTVDEAARADLSGATAVVVDVIRATTTLTAALEAGAAAIFPVASSEEAIKLLQSLGREDTLLAGERKGLPIEGYHLGNSPSEFTRDRVEGKRIIMNTTNGTRALLAAEAADRVLAAAFTNLAAASRRAATSRRVVVVCAGRDGRFALEDAVCAGGVVGHLREFVGGEVTLEDGARAALELALSHTPDRGFLAGTAAGRALADVGLAGDVLLCARTDVTDLVPEMRDRVMRRGPVGGT